MSVLSVGLSGSLPVGLCLPPSTSVHVNVPKRLHSQFHHGAYIGAMVSPISALVGTAYTLFSREHDHVRSLQQVVGSLVR